MSINPNRITYIDILDVIELKFGKNAFTVKALREIVNKNFPQAEKPKDLNATVCTMATRKLLKKMEHKSEDGRVQYARTDTPYGQSVVSSISNRVYKYRDILKEIEKHFQPERRFTQAELKRYCDIPEEISIAHHFRKLVSLGKLDYLGLKSSAGGFLYKLPKKIIPQSEQSDTKNKAPAKESKPDPSIPVPGQNNSAYNPESDSNAPEKILLTTEILEALNIPFSVLGEAIYTRMRDLIRELITYQESEAKLQRENATLKGRMAEQYKQIESLNKHIGNLNDKLAQNRKSDSSSNGFAKLGEMARVSLLKKANKN